MRDAPLPLPSIRPSCARPTAPQQSSGREMPSKFWCRSKAGESGMQQDTFKVYGTELQSRLLVGSAQYPSPAILADAVKAAGAQVVTVSLRRESGSERAGERFWALIRELGVKVLPNTAGCRGLKEAVATAQMAREVFGTNWIKLEVIGEDDTLQPDVFGLVEAAGILVRDGFQVFPYTTEDLIVAEKLLGAGCEVLMPWGAPIGSGRGLNNPFGLKALRKHFPNVPLIIDAGIGTPSHAVAAMELGYEAVLLNTAIAKAGDPVAMASAFALAVEAGRYAYLADPMLPRDMAEPSTPHIGRAFSDLARA
jgi:thiazole synthase